MAWTPPASDAVSAWTPPAADAVDERKFAYVPPKEGGFLAKDPKYTYGAILPFRTESNPEDQKTASQSGGMLPFIAEHVALPDFIREPLQGAVQWGQDLMGRGQAVGSSATDKELTTLASLVGAKPFGMSSVARGTGMKIAAAAPGAASAAVKAAQEAGYVLPPNMASETPGAVASAVQSLGGEIKTQQLASVKNQAVTNKLATKAIGLPEGTLLNEAAFRTARAPALQTYKEMASSIPQIAADDEFKTFTSDLGGRSKAAATRFPNVMKNEGVNELGADLSKLDGASPQEAMDLVRTLRAEAKANLKAFDDPKKTALGQAQKKAADAVDALMERNLEKTHPDLVQQYREARQLLAKSYDVEEATNTATGNVSAHHMSRLAKKGRPLTGELKVIADTATSFSKATQDPSAFGGYKRWSAVDAGVALGSLFTNPTLTAAIAARPLARDLALSRVMQNRPIPPRQPNMLLNALRPVTLNSIMRPVQQPSEPMVPSFARP